MKKVLVIGSGFSGLTIAHKLSRTGFEVTVIDAREWAGGRYRRARTEDPFEIPDLGFFPNTPEHVQAFESLEKELNLGLVGQTRKHQALTHTQSEWREFIGFGDDPASSVGWLSQLNVKEELIVAPGFDQTISLLLDNPPFEIKTRAEVTEFEVLDGKIVAATVNGSDRMTADQFIFCPTPNRLLDLIPGDGLKSATRSRLARSTGFAAVTLKLEHRELSSDNPDLRFLLGTGKEFEPAVGRIYGSTSSWLSLVPMEKVQEADAIGGQIRAIKRVLRRHWPELLDLTTRERILVQEEAYGYIELKSKSHCQLNELSNLWLANHRLSHLIGSLAEWDAARTVLSDFSALSGSAQSELFVAQPPNPVLSQQEL